MSRRVSGLLLAAAGVVLDGAQAQVAIRSWEGSVSGGQLGRSLAGLGDSNDDGVPDFVFAEQGGVGAYSGVDGMLLWRVDRGRVVASVGDLDGDGRGDVAVSTTQKVMVLSGVDGTSLGVWRGGRPEDEFGAAIDGIGDIDGDGIGDVLIGAPGVGDGGRAFAYSGADGGRLASWQDTSVRSGFGGAVAGLGDWDGDGVPDIAIGAGEADRVEVYSGSTGALIVSPDGANGSDFGAAVAGAGDVDGDGLMDMIVGRTASSCGDGRDCGAAEVRIGPSAVEIARFNGDTADGLFGLSVAGVGDLDGDGLDDVAAGGLNGAVAYSPDRERELWRVEAGWAVAAAGDVDGDGLADVLVGQPLHDGPGGVRSGRVLLYSGAGRLAIDSGCLVGCPSPSILLDIEGANPGSEPAALSVGLVSPLAAELLEEAVDAGPFALARQIDLDPTQLPSEYCPAALVIEARLSSVGGPTQVARVTVQAVAIDDVPPSPDLPGSPPLLREWLGEREQSDFGWALAANADVDADGVPDTLVGARERVYVYSGATGTLVRLWLGRTSSFGEAVDALPDVDGDGHDDVLVGNALAACDSGAIFCGRALLYSGGRGELLHSWPGEWREAQQGRYVAYAGDVDGDGTADAAVSSPSLSGPLGSEGRVYVYSGGDGELIHAWSGEGPSAQLGPVDGAGDVDGDGIDDVVVGGLGGDGVSVYRGSDGTRLWTHGVRYSEVSGVGDVDGDGLADVFVTHTIPDSYPDVHRGLDGAVLLELPLEATATIAGIDDVDHDGRPDLVAGSCCFAADGVGVYSSGSGELLSWIDDESPRTGGASAVAFAGDVDGDGRGDLLVGQPGFGSDDLLDVGRALLYEIGVTSSISIEGTCRTGCPDGTVTYQVRGHNRTLDEVVVNIEMVHPRRLSLFEADVSPGPFSLGDGLSLPSTTTGGSCPRQIRLVATLTDRLGAVVSDELDVELVSLEP